jgi:hypothetical protein
MKGSIVLLVCLAWVACGKVEKVSPPEISHELQEEMETWLAAEGRPPADYVLELFEDHDVVVLGENHLIRHDVELVHQLLERLHEVDVNVFAMEFARRSDQARIDSLLSAADWDETTAREIIFRMFMPWGLREYVDILKIAWQVKREGCELRVIGVNNTLDYSHFQKEADWNDDEVWKLVLGDQTEADWAAAILEEVDMGEKVLVYSGINHAFTGFKQPRVINGSFVSYSRVRMGYKLRDELGERAVTVFLHSPWNGAEGYDAKTVHPGAGRLDAFMLSRAAAPFPVGFNLADSPLAGLPIEDAVYMHGHEPFSVDKFCDGWIYTKPIAENEPVRYIEGWIHEGNAAEARATAMNPRWRDDSVDSLNIGCKSYLQDFERVHGHLR